ncbi:MAG: cupin domain-containing protein [Gemmatimonadaceae bacterium]
MTQLTQQTTTLSRRNTLLTAGALALSASAARLPSRALAHDATPAAVPGGLELGGAEIKGAPGVWAEVFTALAVDRVPDYTIYTIRFTFFPDSDIFLHRHPGWIVLAVDTGTFGWTLGRGVAYVIRGAKTGETAVEEVSEPEAVVTLDPGDIIYYDDDVAHWAHNAGADTVSLLSTFVLTSGRAAVDPG